MQYLPCSLAECTDEVLQQSARLPRLRRGEGYYDMWGGHVTAEELRRKAVEQEGRWEGETSEESGGESDGEGAAACHFEDAGTPRVRRKERWAQNGITPRPNVEREAEVDAWRAGRGTRQPRQRESGLPGSAGSSRPSSRSSRPSSRPSSRCQRVEAPAAADILLPDLRSGQGSRGSSRGGSSRPGTVEFTRKYKGGQARADFFRMYHSMKDVDGGARERVRSNGSRKTCSSARHSFLQVCDRFGLAPRPLLLIPGGHKSKDARSLHAKDRGIGPRFAEAIAASLDSVYSIRHINLADNRIGLKGCRLLANSLGGGNLVSLDLSGNHLGPQSSKPLTHVLRNNLNLSWLNVGANDLGNACVRGIVQTAVDCALPLVHLNLSKNNVSSVGAVAVGKLLPKLQKLQLLDLSWNGINGRGAQTLISAVTKAIQANRLEEVHLGWNAAGLCSAIEGLARALQANTSMQFLDLRSNNIQEKTAVVFAESLFSNKTLSKLILDDNPLGRLGICALMATPSEVFLSIENCTFKEQGSFNPESPNGYYRLDLSKAYDRAIVGSLQRLAAADQGENWKNEKLNGVPFNFPEDDIEGWEIPEKGILEVTYVATPKADAAKKESNSRIASDETCQRLARFIDKQPNDAAKAEVIHTACAYFFFNALQLEALTSRILARQLKLDAVVSGWMRTVESTSHLRKWVEGWLTSPEQEALAEKLGPLLYFETELPSGHYVLDLADPRGQHIAANLQRMGNAERQKRKKRELPDTSSTHNHGPWRNCYYSLSNSPSVSQWDIPTRGVFRLDYFSATRPPNFSKPVPASAFIEFKTNLSRALKDVASKESSAGAFWGALKKCTSGKAKWNQAKQSVMTKIRSERQSSSLFEVAQLLRAVNSNRAAQDTAFNMMKCVVSSQGLLFSSEQAIELVGLFPAATADVFMEMGSEGSTNSMKKMRPKKEGKSRICAAVALASQVVDGSFLTKLRGVFSPEEVAEFIHRVGWLNVWNPLEPDGDYVLDLAKHDTREVARMLTALEYAGVAPKRAPLWRAHGDEQIVPDAKNFQNTKLNGQFFEVPYTWHSEGLPTFGRLTSTFTPVGPFPKEVAERLLKTSCLLGEHCEGWLQ